MGESLLGVRFESHVSHGGMKSRGGTPLIPGTSLQPSTSARTHPMRPHPKAGSGLVFCSSSSLLPSVVLQLPEAAVLSAAIIAV